MRSLALDTNTYTTLGRGDKTLAQLLAKAPTIGLPITVLGEIYYGTYNGNRQADNESILANFLANNRVEILHTDEATAKLFGEIATQLRRSGSPMQQNDIWIAALCKQHDYALVTNDKGFSNVLGLEIVNYANLEP